nr:thioredoxin-dependent thiol peroxidase [Cystobacter sp.]
MGYPSAHHAHSADRHSGSRLPTAGPERQRREALPAPGEERRPLLLPKDDTPGCTREACDFRDEHSALQAAGAVVLGVSPDDTRSHQKFATKFSLPFPLLADTGHKVAESYGVWGEKSLYGRTFMGITRATFLIDTEGKLARVWPKVKVQGHVQDILQSLKGGAQEAEGAPVRKKAPAKKAAAAGKPAAKAKKTPASRK